VTSQRLTVQSKHGVAISIQKSGSGPALLLVHGAALDSSVSWSLVLPSLTQHFTVYAMDRRGRPPSGDATTHTLAAEVEDLAAVIDSIGQPLTLLGHSYGAVLALAALDHLKNVTRLILYEPPVFESPRDPRYEKIVEAMERALDANDREQVVTVFLRDQVGTPPSILERLRSSPVWPKAIELAATLPRESRVVNTFRLDPDRLGKLTIPTTMLVGSESPSDVRDGTMFVCRSIPGCATVVLEGQGHSAMLSGPDLFVAKVLQVVCGSKPVNTWKAGRCSGHSDV
jgi:pimeloyl-ACP methyl ester carboxylesterase